jgi:Ca2+-binding RTX toxin-like protein
LGSATPASAGDNTCDGHEATIVGTPDDDTLTGTPGSDVIVGGPGADTIRGGSGDDVICGGPGNDALAGQGEDDRLFGDPGDDLLDGGEGGCCFVPTNTGDDLLRGGPGNDTLHTSDFPILGNTLHGDEGDDQLFVWTGGWAFGGNGQDVIRRFSGDAQLDGGNGNDDLLDWDDGGLRNETVTLAGGNGSDTLGSGDTTSTSHLDGGNGTDTCFGEDTSSGCEA